MSWTLCVVVNFFLFFAGGLRREKGNLIDFLVSLFLGNLLQEVGLTGKQTGGRRDTFHLGLPLPQGKVKAQKTKADLLYIAILYPGFSILALAGRHCFEHVPISVRKHLPQTSSYSRWFCHSGPVKSTRVSVGLPKITGSCPLFLGVMETRAESSRVGGVRTQVPTGGGGGPRLGLSG